MKYFKILLTLTLLLITLYQSVGQGIQLYDARKMERYKTDYMYEVKPGPAMKQIIDSILPGVRIIHRGYTTSNHTKFMFVYENDTNYLDYSNLQFKLGLEKDSVFHFSDVAAIKTFIYLQYILLQRTNYNGEDITPDQIKITPFFLKYEGSPHQIEMKESCRINYKVEILKDLKGLSIKTGVIPNPSSLQYLIQLDDKFVTYYNRIVTDSTGVADSTGLSNFQGPFNMKYYKRKYHNINSSFEGTKNRAVDIRFAEYTGNDNPYYSSDDDSRKYLYLTTGIDNNSANAKTKFLVEGLSNSNELQLRISTVGGFGSSIIDLAQIDLIPNGSPDTYITNNFFIPLNDNNDGFCSIEIWQKINGIYEKLGISTFFLVLQKRMSSNAHSKILHVYYAKRFFHNATGGIGSCDQYINDVINNYDATWDKQVNQYFNGLRPANSNGQAPAYLVSVNPLQEVTNYVFWFNLDYLDCYEVGESFRHIGVTANPHNFMDKKMSAAGYNNLGYSESEFLETEIFHEFYHGMQYTFNDQLFLGGLDAITKKRWLIEGQARFIQTLTGNPEIEFKQSVNGTYRQDANRYILNNLNKSLLKLSYDYSLFWRFLFENSTTSGNIADKLAIFRQTCEGFNATNITDIEKHMNQKLQSTPFKTMDNAVVEYAKRVLFNDPEYNTWNPCPSVDFYARVPYLTINYNGTETSRKNNINSSYGIDYYLISFQATGKTLINFNGDPNNDGIAPHYNVNLYFLDSPDSPVNINIVKGVGSKEIELLTPNRMAFLAITRIDDKEDSKLTEDYGIIIGPRVPANRINASFSAGGNKSGSGYYPTGALIDFYDQSYGGNHPLTQWNWTFTGGYPSNSSLQNPEQIYYLSPGSYPVSLTVSNSAGEFDSKTINGYINVYDPGNGTTYEELDLTTHCQSYAQANQQASLSLWINSGTPPYQISISTDNQQTVIYSGQSSETFHHIFNSWSNSGTKGIWYLVTDALGNTGESYESISIGLPGSHAVNFSYIWNTSYPNNLGTNTEVFFTDLTDGGYKPYYLWIWEYGAGINTGSIPLNTDGKNWEMRYNAWDDADFDGSPLHPVVFTEYDSYPVTLTVYDNAGFQKTKTVLIDVSTATKCMKLEPNFVSRYNSKLNKHIIEYESGSYEEIYFHAHHSNYFPWKPPSYCTSEYPFSGIPGQNDPSKSNVITDIKFSIGTMNYYKQDRMPDYYVDHPYPSSPFDCYSQPQPNCCNFLDNVPNTYWSNWVYFYYNTENYPLECYPYMRNPNDIQIIFPSAGKYIMRLEAWNRFSQPNQSAFIPAQEPNLEMYDYIDVPLYVVDCDATEYINTTINPGVYNDDLAGIFEFSNISASTIESGAEITYQSCNQIIMHPGFSALSGSSFLAQVTTLANDDDALLREMLVNSTMDFEPNDFYSCYPNPNGGIFRITHPGTLKSNNIDIFNLSGQPVNFTALDMDFETMIQISNPVTGVYFVRLLLDSGEVLYKKVIVSRF